MDPLLVHRQYTHVRLFVHNIVFLFLERKGTTTTAAVLLCIAVVIVHVLLYDMLGVFISPNIVVICVVALLTGWLVACTPPPRARKVGLKSCQMRRRTDKKEYYIRGIVVYV